jgi:hypothetical protein
VRKPKKSRPGIEPGDRKTTLVVARLQSIKHHTPGNNPKDYTWHCLSNFNFRHSQLTPVLYETQSKLNFPKNGCTELEHVIQYIGCIYQMQSMENSTVLGCNTVSLDVWCPVFQGNAGGRGGMPGWVTWVLTGKTWLVSYWMEFWQASRMVWEMSGLQVGTACKLRWLDECWRADHWSVMNRRAGEFRTTGWGTQ